MAALNWYLTNNSVSVGSDLSETDPGTEAYRSPVSGWVVSVTAAGNYSSYYNDVERAASTFGATAQPDGTLDTTNGDFWTSPTALTGSFAATDWTIYAAVRANTRAAGQDGRMRARIFKGTNQDGSGATEVTSSATNGTTVTDLLTSATQVSTITINPGAFTCTNEYVFIQLAWEITGDATNATADVNLRIGNGSSSGCRVVTSDFTAGGGGGSGTISPQLATQAPEKSIQSIPFASDAGYNLLVTDHTGTISNDPALWPPELHEAIAKCCCQGQSSSMISRAFYQSPCCPILAADTLTGRVAGTQAHNTGLRLRYNPAFTLNILLVGTPPDWLPFEGLKHPWGHNAHWWSDLYYDYSYTTSGSGVWRVTQNSNPWIPQFVDVPYTVEYSCNVYFYVKYGHRMGLPPTICNSQLVQIAYPVGQFNYDPDAYLLALFISGGNMPPNPEPITWRNLVGNSLVSPGTHGVRNAVGFLGQVRLDNIVGEAETSPGCNQSEYHICNNQLQHRKIFLGLGANLTAPIVISPVSFTTSSGIGVMTHMMSTAIREPLFNCLGIGQGDPSVLANRPRIEVDT